MAKFLSLWVLVHWGGRLPIRVLYACGWLIGMLAWYLRPTVRAVTRDHMRRVLGPQATAKTVDHHARRCSCAASYYYADFARAYHESPERLLAGVDEIVGIEEVFHAHDEGNGLILASAHLGNPELVSQVLDVMGLNLVVITEPLEPPRVHRFVHRIRGRRDGVCYAPASLQTLRTTITHLRAGGTVGLLIDRDVLGTGIPFPFFGTETRMPPGAVELVRRTGAALVVASVLRTTPGRFRIEIERIPSLPPSSDREADLLVSMQDTVSALERAIRRDPGQWFALTPVWNGASASTEDHEIVTPEALQSER